MKHVKFKLDDRNVAYLTLNRPEIHNAFNDELIGELTLKIRELNKDEDVRLIVLTGEGKSFCAGADLNWMKSMKSYSLEENIEDSEKLNELFSVINNLEKPVIGKINGHAFGGGVGLVSVCDFVISASDAKFGFTEVRLGLVPAVISPYVVDKIGKTNARAWFISGDRFYANVAQRMGLVHEVVGPEDLDSRCEEIISNFLKAAPIAQSFAKKLIRDISSLDRKEVAKYTTNLIANLRISDEGQEGMDALLEKRKPKWI